MSTLLLKLQGLRTLNYTIFPPYLYIHDDIMFYKKRRWFWVKEITISYNQISQITLHRGIFFSNLEIITTGTDDIYIKFVPTKIAVTAKKIIDQKIYHSHAKHQQIETGSKISLSDYEKTLSRLRELLNKGQISEREYLKKKQQLIKNI